MTEITITLPYPPSANTYWRYVGSKPKISFKGRAYKADVEAAVFDVFNGRPPRLAGRLAVRINLVMPDKRKRDIDNIQKPLLDAMEKAGVYQNDNQIDDLHTVRGNVDEQGDGLAIVTIRCLDDLEEI